MPARGPLSTDSLYSAGRGASGAAEGTGVRAASIASFSICFGVGMRQLADRSVISELEHKTNKSRVRASRWPKKIVLWGAPRCRNQASSIVLNPASVLEFPMAPRANWKGFLRLSLVTCPVALYPATSESEKVSFNQLNRKTGHRIKYAKVDADTGEEVDNEVSSRATRSTPTPSSR